MNNAGRNNNNMMVNAGVGGEKADEPIVAILMKQVDKMGESLKVFQARVVDLEKSIVKMIGQRESKGLCMAARILLCCR
jgi:hypothetical protein